MNYSPLAVKRSNILGEIYKKCDTIESVPVYLNDSSGELLGYADESLGNYADAFVFHLPETVCKQLSTNYFDYAFDFEYAEKNEKPVHQKRIKLNHILLITKLAPLRKNLSKKEPCLENVIN